MSTTAGIYTVVFCPECDIMVFLTECQACKYFGGILEHDFDTRKVRCHTPKYSDCGGDEGW